MARRVKYVCDVVADGDCIAVAHRRVDVGNAVTVIARRNDPGAGGGPDGGIATGVVEMMVGVPDLGDPPAGGVRLGQDTVGLGRVDGHGLAAARIVHQEAVIVRKAGELPDDEFAHCRGQRFG